MEEFNENKLMTKYKSGLKGGPFNKIPPLMTRTIVEGYPSESIAKMQGSSIPKSTPMDSWNSRRSK